MDMWVVGAAAAAGYIAKQLKQSRVEDSSLESSFGATECEKPGTFSCPLRRLTRRRKQAKDAGESFLPRLFDSGSDAEAASVSGFGQKLENMEDYDDCSRNSVLDSSNLLAGGDVPNSESNLLAGGDVPNSNVDHFCVKEMDAFHSPIRNRASLRTKRFRRHFIKPSTSLESCLMAQWYDEHTRVQEYVLSTFPSPSNTVRPFIVTDGAHVISRAKSDTFTRIRKDSTVSQENVAVLGVSPLPRFAPLSTVKKVKPKAGRGTERFSVSTKASSQKQSNLHNGLRDGASLVGVGICIGVISSLLANRREVHQLKNLLKQTENLVQDLQEELEMKDSLTVKELVNENCESQGTCENSLSNGRQGTSSPVRKVDNPKTDGCEALYDEKAEASLESMSKIEAELEAELERLGLNMTASNSERRVSDLVEMDPDYEPDFAEGELRASTISNRTDGQPESDRAASSTSTMNSAKYAVSPRELSLRLHQVIQSRLEERVRELETALQTSQRKVLHMEAESKSALRNMPVSMLRYSSDEESPIARDQPLVINLSGGALDAYNEAYEELSKPNGSESDDSPYDVYKTIHRVGLPSREQSFSRSQILADGTSAHLYQTNLFDSEHDTKTSSARLYDGGSEDEKSDGSEEMQKQLIRQIVEKSKKGSPAVLNAQRVLFSTVDDAD